MRESTQYDAGVCGGEDVVVGRIALPTPPPPRPTITCLLAGPSLPDGGAPNACAAAKLPSLPPESQITCQVTDVLKKERAMCELLL